MTKRMRGNLPEGVRINETQAAVLAEIERREGGTQWGVPIALGTLGEALGKNKVTARRACQALLDQALIDVRVRYGSNGGRLENEYALTDKGRAVLEALR